MSIWTHVNASIRIDALRFEKSKKINFEDLLVVSTYENPNPDTTLPCGSEGSLEWSLWKNPSESSLFSYNLNIFGDLRDYSSENKSELIDWWKKLLKNFYVRQAVLQVEFEDEERCYIYNENGKKVANYKIEY